MMPERDPVRFEAASHTYYLAGAQVPHITGLLLRSGWVDDRWFTEESAERGTQIHRLTADYDLGALELESCVSRYRPYLLSHVAAVQVMRPELLAVEEPTIRVGPGWRFGGRPDREGRFWGLLGVLEGKSGGPSRAHQIQTALQAILVAPKYGVKPEALARFCLYWKASGRFTLEEHTARADFLEASRILREFAGA